MTIENYILFAIYSSSTIGAVLILILLRRGLPWFIK